MIENEVQLRVTLRELRKFRLASARIPAVISPEFKKIYLDAFASTIEELEAEVQAYLARRPPPI